MRCHEWCGVVSELKSEGRKGYIIDGKGESATQQSACGLAVKDCPSVLATLTSGGRGRLFDPRFRRKTLKKKDFHRLCDA